MPGIEAVAEYTTVLAQVTKNLREKTYVSIAKLRFHEVPIFRHFLLMVSFIVLALLLVILQFGE